MKDYRKQIERHANDLQYRWGSVLLYEQNRTSKKTSQQRNALRASIARMRVLLDELEQVAQQDMVFSEIDDEE